MIRDTLEVIASTLGRSRDTVSKVRVGEGIAPFSRRLSRTTLGYFNTWNALTPMSVSWVAGLPAFVQRNTLAAPV